MFETAVMIKFSLSVALIFLALFGNVNSLSFEFSPTAWPSKNYGKLHFVKLIILMLRFLFLKQDF